MGKKTEHIGTISGRELLKAPIGHQQHTSGTGAHKNRSKCKKRRRNEDRRQCRDW